MMPTLDKFKRLDVRVILRQGRDPCAPIFEHVSRLKPDEGLIIIAPFLPSPLIEKLGGEGFASKVERGLSGEWMVYFWRKIG